MKQLVFTPRDGATSPTTVAWINGARQFVCSGWVGYVNDDGIVATASSYLRGALNWFKPTHK